MRSGRVELNSALRRIYRLANGAVLDNTTYSVMSKPFGQVAPSGNPHDFYTLARYFWPVAGSTLYSRFDGFVNPESYLYTDSQYLRLVLDDILYCSLAFFFSGNETFAETATSRINAWFLDPNTAMNPNLDYANWVSGSTLSSINSAGGLLDFQFIHRLFDSVGLLRNSNAWTDLQSQALTAWFESFLNWFQTSARGTSAQAAANNQGTWYDSQQVSILLYLGQVSAASTYITAKTLPRISGQFSPSGSQPLELVRPFSWQYSSLNLQGLCTLATLAQSTDVDLFRYSDTQNASIHQGLTWMIPYAISNGAGWPVVNTGNFKTATINELFKEAYVAYRDSSFLDASNTIQNNVPVTWAASRLWSPYNSFDAPIRSSGSKMSTRLLLVILSIISIS